MTNKPSDHYGAFVVIKSSMDEFMDHHIKIMKVALVSSTN